MISVLSVNRNCRDWMELLVKSVRKFTTFPHEILIVDNDSEDGSQLWLDEQNYVRSIQLESNVGHGRGMDMAIRAAQYRFCLILDIDAHIMRAGWDFDLVSLYGSCAKRRLIAAKGGERKPVHPCFMFLDKEFFLDQKMSFMPTREYDVGRKLYPDTLDAGYEAFRVPVGYEDVAEKRKFYPGAYGDVYYVNAEATVYHNWYSSRMYAKEQVDSLTREEHLRTKALVFDHPHVRSILGEGE